MEIRNRSKTGPLVAPLAEIPAKLSQQVDAVKQQWLDQLNRDPASFARLEVEIHDHFRRLADQVTASLLAEATIPQDQAEPGKRGRRPGRPPTTRPAAAAAEASALGWPGRLDRHDLLCPAIPHRPGARPRGDRSVSRVGRPGHPQGSHAGPAQSSGTPDRLAPLDRTGPRRTPPPGGDP